MSDKSKTCGGCRREPTDLPDEANWINMTVALHFGTKALDAMGCFVCSPPCLGPAMRIYADKAEQTAREAEAS